MKKGKEVNNKKKQREYRYESQSEVGKKRKVESKDRNRRKIKVITPNEMRRQTEEINMERKEEVMGDI